jgi:ubiquinone/menaquinone biosynthesis C-methylase UbiE
MTQANWAEKTLLNNSIWLLAQRRHLLSVWKDSLLLPGGSTLLEVGCGRGAGAVMLFEEFNPSRLDAFDVDEYMVTKAKRYASEYEGKINIRLGDVSKLDAPDETYDAVFDSFTLHHVVDWRKGLSEISRVLKPGGYFAFGELYGNTIRSYVIRNILHHPLEERFDRGHLVKALAENRMRLMERKNNLWGMGMIGVAKKS